MPAFLARPRRHFTAPRGWLNDPNGLVYAYGEYHLFYQHNPTGVQWGNMHWGHAVSPDLFHWQDLGDAVFPDPRRGDWAFSGCAILDRDNVAGLQEGSEPPILVFYTSTARGECLLYSNDRGRTFKEYAGNPVVRHAGRDPKVFFHAPTARWVMTVYEEVNHIAFYSSADLRHWDFESRIHGFYECPDLFELDGRWVLTAADGRYQLGKFDGHAFEPETLPRPLFGGGRNYAGQSYSNLDGRRVMVFWLRGEAPFAGQDFNQQMSLPVELRRDGDQVLVTPAVTVPEAAVLENTTRPLRVHGVAVPPSKEIVVVDDVASVETFRDGGAEYAARERDFPRPKVMVFGETLFDVRDGRATLGGAPLNLAVHLYRQGAEVELISAVGQDAAGADALRQIAACGLDVKSIAQVPHPTGRVDITLDTQKVPEYAFSADAAYDHIPLPPAGDWQPDLLCFGTLAQRGPESRGTLRALRERLGCPCFCDLNLRQDFYDREIVAASLNAADIVKINDDELLTVTKLLGLPPEAQALRERYAVKTLVVTRGPAGCEVFFDGGSFSLPARPCKVADTVGAGDAFSAAFLWHCLTGSDLEVAAAAGNALAATVAAQEAAF